MAESKLAEDSATACGETATEESNYLFGKIFIKAIKPLPGICIKAMTDKNEKIFINLCHHPEITTSPPEFELLIDGNSEDCAWECFLSPSGLHFKKDEKGEECMCFDILMNSDLYHRKVFRRNKCRDFFRDLACHCVHEKYKINFSSTFRVKILNKPFHGRPGMYYYRISNEKDDKHFDKDFDYSKVLPFGEEPVTYDTEIAQPKKEDSCMDPGEKNDTEGADSEADDPFRGLNIRAITPRSGNYLKAKTDKNKELHINLVPVSFLPPPSGHIQLIIDGKIILYKEFPLIIDHLPLFEKHKSGYEYICADVKLNAHYFSNEVLLKKGAREQLVNFTCIKFEEIHNIKFREGDLIIFNEPNHEIIPYCYCGENRQTVRVHTDDKIYTLMDVSKGKSSETPPKPSVSVKLSNSGGANSKQKENLLMTDIEAKVLETAFSHLSTNSEASKPMKIKGETVILNNSNAANDEFKKCNLIEDTKVEIPKVAEHDQKTKTGTEEICTECNCNTTINVSFKPKFGFCAKTRTNGDDKIFLNLCYHNALIRPPRSMNVKNLKNLQKALSNFPFIIGELRTVKDKFGKVCKCIEIVVNTNYYHEEVLQKDDHLYFVYILAGIEIEKRHGFTIDVGGITILNQACFGKST